MKFNIKSRELYTNSGSLIKKLDCPLKIKFSQLTLDRLGKLNCKNCKSEILDTAKFNDSEVLKKMKESPEQCLKVNLNQRNIKIITNGN
jgi:hypothetical protein